MYTVKNFRTKKALKEAVAAWNEYAATGTVKNAGIGFQHLPQAVRYYQPGPFGGNEPRNGSFCCEGPHYPEAHRWYATCEAVDGIIVKVK